ncbi:MAG TPA: RIP metalloprotease RseP [Chthoniobacteraceae bacterium]|nr:RIP metalloprotease RseP [Chthoniobacteraceae bacterium]
MILDVLKFLFICLEVVLLFNLLILVHELGHFLAAKWRGLVVEKFAIWFGKPLWSKKIGGVEYRLGCIPAGGYVAIPQLAPMEVLEGQVETDRSQLPPVKPLDKIIVAAAGPAFSLGLAFVFACIVWVVGRPVSEMDTSTVVGYVVPNGPAAKAGIQQGDRILSVDGHTVKRFSPLGGGRESVIWNIARSETPVIPIVVERDGVEKKFEVEPVRPDREGWGRRNLKQILIVPAMTPRIAKVTKDSPAAEAGLKSQDLVLEANGKKLLSGGDLADLLKAGGTAPIQLTVKRGSETLNVTVTPRIPTKGEQVPRIGVLWDERGASSIVYPNPFEQVVGSVITIVETVSAVLSPKSGITLQHLSGPVGIMNLYYKIFESPDGWQLALWFSVVLNVNLALLNLLPIPVLDGGHITLAIIEGIRKRPINVRVLEFVQTGCALLIIGFMLYVTFYDVLDLPWKRQKAEALPEEMTFSPSPSQSPQP